MRDSGLGIGAAEYRRRSHSLADRRMLSNRRTAIGLAPDIANGDALGRKWQAVGRLATATVSKPRSTRTRIFLTRGGRRFAAAREHSQSDPCAVTRWQRR